MTDLKSISTGHTLAFTDLEFPILQEEYNSFNTACSLFYKHKIYSDLTNL